MELTVFMLTIVILSTPPNTVKLLKQNNLLKKPPLDPSKLSLLHIQKRTKKIFIKFVLEG